MTMLNTIKSISDKEILNNLWSNAKLTKDEKTVLKRHYGFNYGNGKDTVPQTFHFISNKLKMEYSLVKAIHDSGLEKLRQTAKENKITWRGMSI